MKKQKIASNFLDKIPTRNPDIGYTVDEKGVITLEIENKGLFNPSLKRFLKSRK